MFKSLDSLEGLVLMSSEIASLCQTGNYPVLSLQSQSAVLMLEYIILNYYFYLALFLIIHTSYIVNLKGINAQMPE